MTRRTYNQAGFEIVFVAVALVFVAVIGFAGYTVLNKSTGKESSSITAGPGVPATIKTQADLDATGKALDSSSGQIDSKLNDKSLDADLNAML